MTLYSKRSLFNAEEVFWEASDWNIEPECINSSRCHFSFLDSCAWKSLSKDATKLIIEPDNKSWIENEEITIGGEIEWERDTEKERKREEKCSSKITDWDRKIKRYKWC